MNEKEWLAEQTTELRKHIVALVRDYDGGYIALLDLNHRMALFCQTTCAAIYDHAFTEGIKAAALDEDSTEEEVIEFEADDEGDQHP